MDAPDAATDARLAERYGRPQPGSRPGRHGRWGRATAATAVAAVLAAAGLAWVVWAGLGIAGRDAVSDQTVGFSDLSDRSVTLTFQVTKDPASSATCDVRALAEDFSTVGFDTVEVGPASTATVAREVVIRTQQRPVSAEVYVCRPA